MCRQAETARRFQTSPQLLRAVWGLSNSEQKKSGPIGPDASKTFVQKSLTSIFLFSGNELSVGRHTRTCRLTLIDRSTSYRQTDQ